MDYLLKKYKVLEKKGEGTFSEVLKCQRISDGTFWACKKMRHHYITMEQVNSLREVQALRKLNPHPNILELEEILFDKKTGTMFLICELMDMNAYEMIKGLYPINITPFRSEYCDARVVLEAFPLPNASGSRFYASHFFKLELNLKGRKHYLPEEKVRKYIYQLLKSLEHLHRSDV